MKSGKVRVALLNRDLYGEKPLISPHTPQQTRRVLLGCSVLSSPAICATVAQARFIFHRLISSAPQMHSFQFWVALPAISFIFHPHGLGSAEFLSVKSLSLAKSDLGYQGCQVSFAFNGKGFVSFHPEFLAHKCSFATLLFHFVRSLFRQGFDRLKSFLLLAKVFVAGKIWSRWVWCFLSSQSVGVP